MPQLATGSIEEELKLSTRHEIIALAADYAVSESSISSIVQKITIVIGDRIFRSNRQIQDIVPLSTSKRADNVLMALDEFAIDLSTQTLDATEALIGAEFLCRNFARYVDIERSNAIKEIAKMRGKIRQRFNELEARAYKTAANLTGNFTDRESIHDPLDRKREYMFYDAYAIIRGPRRIEIIDFNNDIMSVTVNLTTDINPGNFSISLANPGEQYVDDYGVYSFYTGDTIKIFATRRLQDDKKDRYCQIFWGIIEQVIDDYSDGSTRITLSGQDIMAWFQYTTVRPTPTKGSAIGMQPGTGTNNYMHKYQDQPILSILADVIFNDVGDFNSFEAFIPLRGDPVANKSEAQTEADLFRAAPPASASQQSVIEFWKELFLNDLKVRVFGYSKSITLSNAKDVAASSRNTFKAGIGQTASDPASTGDGILLSQEVETELGTKEENRQLGFDNDTRCDALKILNHYVPIRMLSELGIANNWQLEDTPKLEVLRRIIEGTMFELFMDVDGVIQFKPPFYNEYPVNNDTKRYENLTKTTQCAGGNTTSFLKADQESRDVKADEYTIEDMDIVSFTIKEDSSGIVTRQEVLAEPYAYQAPIETHSGSYQNNDLLKRYGLRVGSPKKQRMLKSSDDAITFAKSLMDFINLKYYSATITIIGRPELHLGRTIYLQARNVIFYITGLSHSFTAGNTFLTTLTVTAGRRMYVDEKGQPIPNIFDGEQFDVRSIHNINSDTAENIRSIDDLTKQLNTAKPDEMDGIKNQISSLQNRNIRNDTDIARRDIYNRARKDNQITSQDKKTLGAAPRRITDSFGRRLYGTLPYGLMVTPPVQDKPKDENGSNNNTIPVGQVATQPNTHIPMPPFSSGRAANSPAPNPYLLTQTSGDLIAEGIRSGSGQTQIGQKLVLEKTKSCTNNSDNKAFNPSSIIKKRIVNGTNL